MTWVILADSSFYIAAGRRGEDAFAQFRADYPDCELVTCGMVMLEVLPWIRSTRVLAHTRREFSRLSCVPTQQSTWELAQRITRELIQVGRPINPQDILIAACAMEAGATVLTLDQHFSEIVGLKVITAKRVSPLTA